MFQRRVFKPKRRLSNNFEKGEFKKITKDRREAAQKSTGLSKRVLTGDEDPGGFGDIFNKEMPQRIQMLSMQTWERLFPTKWEQMKIAKPEVLNAHMRMVQAYVDCNLDPEAAIRKVSMNDKGVSTYEYDDLSESGKNFHRHLLEALRQLVR
jgi:hypothetical protein